MKAIDKFSRYLLPFITSLVFVFYCIYHMHLFHFDEDAYILFRYVDMFIQGYGIAFYPFASPAEGATDFLWLVMLISLVKLGIDVGTASIILNGIGVFIVTYILTRLILRIEHKWFKLALLPLSFLWILFFPLTASIGGFSVMLYCGLFLFPLYLIDQRKIIEFIPLFAIVLGLFRPDGVLLGAGLVFISILLIFKEGRKDIVKKFIVNCLLAFIIGVVYFFWRYRYFGELLPLPLYVKQSVSPIDGIKNNLINSMDYKQFYVYLLVLITTVLIFVKNAKNKLILLVPAVLLYCFLLVSQQYQNVGFRFQATIIITLIYVTISILSENVNYTKSRPKVVFVLLIPLIFLISSNKTLRLLYYWHIKDYGKNYVPDFTYDLSTKILKGDEVIALSEAGAFSFWQTKDNTLIDLVGLNTPYTAKNNLNQNYMDSLNIAVMYYYRDNTADPKDFNGEFYKKVNDRNVFASSFGDLKVLANSAENSKLSLAAYQSILYLTRHFDDYDIYYVRFNSKDNSKSTFNVALRKNLGYAAPFEKMMRELKNKNVTSYYELHESRKQAIK